MQEFLIVQHPSLSGVAFLALPQSLICIANLWS